MPFITANPNEYLIVGHRGQIINRGVAARAFLWPGTPYVLLSSTQQEAPFEMTQESRDGIPLTNALRTLEVEREMLLTQAQQQLRKDILPLEQIPLIAEAAAKVWQGANLSIYGETAPIVATIGPLVEILTQALHLSAASRVPEPHHN
jgi:hypothetical protein